MNHKSWTIYDMTTSPPKKGKFLPKFSFCSNQNQNVDLFVHTKICYFLKIPVTLFFPSFFFPLLKLVCLSCCTLLEWAITVTKILSHPVSHRTNILFFVCTIKYSLSEIFADREAEHRCLRIMLCKQARQSDKVFKASGCTELV